MIGYYYITFFPVSVRWLAENIDETSTSETLFKQIKNINVIG